ncbi:MAG: restriction endonuclease subunit S [Phenylobacterium sp.]|uniref:restriction endonuclease subunit S n=1 Tax=Phenylobacterium sp. TaxID=1871053 RepID=UPI001A2B0297|nr:restriction endonuclease subunit S [Phenylobacterium sp.]MBJ7409981.1 restriction endonuclease subunit S [Phenylobacterium sp.]
MGDWIRTTVGEQATLQRGFDITRAAQRPGPVPVVSSSGPSSFHDEAAAKGPGVVLGRKGVVGSVFYVMTDYWPHDTSLWVKDFHGNDPRFVYYFFRSIASELAQLDVGSANPTLNRNHVHPISILWPRSVEEQQRISCLLGGLDDKIELNRRMNETLEAVAQAIYRDWFVDFGPVRRKLAGTTDPIEIMGGLTAIPERAAELAALFPDELTAEGLPTGWSSPPLSTQLDLIGGGTPKTTMAEYWGGSIPWFSVVDSPAASDVFVFDTEKSISATGLAESSARLVPAGTTIISARGTVGNLAVAGRDMTFNQSCYGLRSARGEYPYLVFLTVGRAVEQLRAMAHGSVFSTITRQTFDALPSPSAPSPIMAAAERTIEPLFARIKAAVAENRSLAETRDYLLPRLMSGEVRVAKAELAGAA